MVELRASLRMASVPDEGFWSNRAMLRLVMTEIGANGSIDRARIVLAEQLQFPDSEN
jgi:hypothetical protein